MRIGSGFLRDLQAREGTGPGIAALCIYSTHDNMVTPPETSRLPWARNRIVRGRGHLEMAHCEEVFALLREELGPPRG
jgi:triacylglycerol lipase